MSVLRSLTRPSQLYKTSLSKISSFSRRRSNFMRATMEDDSQTTWSLIAKYTNKDFCQQIVSKQNFNIQEVVQTAGRVIQSSSIILPLALVFQSEGETNSQMSKMLGKLFLVVKIASTDIKHYCNEHHLKRTVASYENEVNFFINYANFLPDDVKIPKFYGYVNDEQNNCLVVVMSDLRQNPSQPLNPSTLRSQEQKLAFNLNETKIVLQWLAKFHAQYFNIKNEEKLQLILNNQQIKDFQRNFSNNSSKGDVWAKGGYWSLDKRQQELDNISQQWDQIRSNLGDELLSILPEHTNLGELLKQNAWIWHNKLYDEQNCEIQKWQTIIHGDFKTANIFLQQEGVSVGVCDYQWSGWGLPVLDVIYVLYTSVQPQVILESEENLLQHYYNCLKHELDFKKNDIFDWKSFLEWYNIAYLDYVRFLVGSMWGKVTENSIAENCNAINQGMHKRDKSHLLNMIKKAAVLLDIQHATPQPSLLVSILNEAVKVAQIAGEEICNIINSAQSLQIKSKGYQGPQTIADTTAEHIIINHLSKKFPQLQIIGEEGSSTTGYSNSSTHKRKLQQAPEIVLDVLQNIDAFNGADMKDITVWVDPLDGTRELLNGNYPGVTVLIGIAVNDRPVAGVIQQPFRQVEDGCTGVLWWGIIGEGVFVGGDKYNMDDSLDEERCVVATSKTWGANLPSDLSQRLRPQRILNVGGAGNKAIMLLEGKISHWVFPRGGTSRWDTCAPEALLTACGGQIVDSFGDLYNYNTNCGEVENSRGVVAARSTKAWKRCLKQFQWS